MSTDRGAVKEDRNLTQSGIYEIPPLKTGGLILTYRCSGSCKHCVYHCSQGKSNKWMSLERLKQTLDTLACEPLLEELHFAGGELGLNMKFTIEAIRATASRGLPVSYIQTNGFWSNDYDKSVEYFTKMKEAGLKKVWISVSPFHLEHIPFARTQTCIDAATTVFSRKNLIMRNEKKLLPLFSSLEKDRTYTLDEFCDVVGINKSIDELAEFYPVTLYGRACKNLKDYCKLSPASEFEGQNCAKYLLNENHFHLDPEGNLITGICPGISVATIEDLHPEITKAKFPVFCTLIEDGPYGLFLWAQKQSDFRWDDRSTFVSRCDLCLQIRIALLQSGIYLKDIHPQSYYENLI